MRKFFSIIFILLASFHVQSTSAADDEEVAAPPAVYFAMPEAFTINFLNQSNKQATYLQIKVSLMAHDQEIITSAEQNLPMLEDALRTLFSEQTFDTVSTLDGRKSLQKTALETVKAILKEETGKENLDAVYFTSFILQ